MEIILHSKSSSGDHYYEVRVIKENNLLKASCNCVAGEWGKFCKHKWQLLHGDESFLHNKNQKSDLDMVVSWVKNSSLDSVYVESDKINNEITNEEKKIKKFSKDIIDKLARNKKKLSEAEFKSKVDSILEFDLKLLYLKYLLIKERSDADNKIAEGF